MSDCVCLYGGNDGDDNTFNSIVLRKAVKEHRCEECRRTIQRGERYEVYSVGYEGSVSSHKACAECSEIRRALYCEGFWFGSLWSDIEDQIFDGGRMNSACLDKLATVAAKQFLQRRWMEWLDRRAAQ